MFDISRCAGLMNALEGCPTPSICVRECPSHEWSYSEGKNESVREYCYNMSDEDWDSSTIEVIQIISKNFSSNYFSGINYTKTVPCLLSQTEAIV